MKIIEKRESIVYICSSVFYYCVAYLEHHTMATNEVRFFSRYNFLRLDHIESHKLLLDLLRSHKFKKVYTDLPKDTVLFKQLKKACISPLVSQLPTAKADLIKDYQNLRGVIHLDKVSISLEIKETIEKYSNLIDLEREIFPIEIKTLGKLSYLVR